MGKSSFESNELIGKKYGVWFSINQQKLTPATISIEYFTASNENNMEINDDTANQKLTHEEIMELKQTVTAETLIETIVTNNVDFHKKTAFSKQKYMERKKLKFLTHVLAEKIDLVTLCEYYQSKQFNIRIDLLSLLLTSANIKSNMSVFLRDDTHGVITSAILQKMNGIGVLHVVAKNLEAMKYMNFEHEKTPLVLVNEPVTEYDAVIIASTHLDFTDCLILSRPLVVYSMSMSFLHELYLSLRSSHSFVMVELISTWFREYQVLPGRCHPMMRMNDTGGCLLTATKVSDVLIQLTKKLK